MVGRKSVELWLGLAVGEPTMIEGDELGLLVGEIVGIAVLGFGVPGERVGNNDGRTVGIRVGSGAVGYRVGGMIVGDKVTVGHEDIVGWNDVVGDKVSEGSDVE